MKNPESHINKAFTFEDLLTRGWTLTLIELFLEPEDDRYPVDHFPELCRREDVSASAR
jgi:hypothetical protein